MKGTDFGQKSCYPIPHFGILPRCHNIQTVEGLELQLSKSSMMSLVSIL